MENKTLLRPYLQQFYRGNGWRLALAVVYILLGVACNLLVTWLIQAIIDFITGDVTTYPIQQLIAMTMGGIGLMALTSGCHYHSIPRFTARAIGQYKDYVFTQLSKKSISAFAGENTSFYISALSNDANTIETKYLGNMFLIAEQVLTFIGALVMMLWYSVELTLISIVLSALPILASILAGNRVAGAEKSVSDKNASYMSTLKDSLVGFSVIKSFRAEARMCRIFSDNVKQATDATCARDKVVVIVQMLSGIAGAVLQFGVFLAGAWLAVNKAGFSVGTVMVFVQMMNYVISPIATVPQYLAERKAAKGLIAKLAEALSQNIREEGKEQKTALEKGIQLSSLSFSYEPEKPTLQNVDFTFERGKRYAIVGASGSGKTTLLNLLMASHNSYHGNIFYDEAELRSLSSGSVYEIVSVVQQNVFIFNASIRDNITMFSDFPKEEVDRAIELSGLSELIAQRGESYLCGENGSGLSGGEKQRISIARSLLKKSQVLLVDEATAALDAQTAWQVSNAILQLNGMTRIVVTHSLDESLLRQYDCILALKSGNVAESGSFQELMEQKGYFYSLYTVSQ